MEQKDIISMSTRELDRLAVIRQVADKKLRQRQAGERLNLSVRQIKRLVAKYRRLGPKGLAHALRSKPSAKAISPDRKSRILRLWKTKYQGFGPTLLAEKLLENESILISDETLRGWYPKDLPRPSWQRRHRPHRKARERKPFFGQMCQTDGSFHDWFEGRGPQCNLQGMIDDATGNVFAFFSEYEGTLPMMHCLKAYSRLYGLPHSFYFDMHTTYKAWKRLAKEDRIQGKEALSQFQRALKELGVSWTHAHSPQAKGRIERLFRTFQDRLIKEMRLANISSIDQANQFLSNYLPKYNQRFAKPPAQEGNWHKQHLTPAQISRALCIKHTRLVQNDSTISYLTQRYLILDPVCKTTLTVETHLDGSLHLRAPGGQELRFKQIPPELYEPQKALPLPPKTTSSPKPYKPAPNHPWRKEFSRAIDLNKARKRGHSYVGI